MKRMAKQGDAVVVHGLRGLPSNRKLPSEMQRASSGDPEAAGLAPFWTDVRRRTVGQAAPDPGGQRDPAGMDDGSRICGRADRARLQEVHGWPRRRSAFGELVQWDTSEHDWLEGRGPVRYLVRMIDDATSWSWGRFVQRDATRHNMGVLWEYLEKHGRMVDVYTDRDSMFTVPPMNWKESSDQQRQADRLTQLGRALRELGIGSILAYSPQAKGRIERSFLTAQDRLVKHLRLAKVSTLESANAFLEKEYWPEWNAHFARPVADFPNQHRSLTTATGPGRHSESRGRAGDRQRLHVLLRRPSLPDRARCRRRLACDASGCAWNSASTAS